MPARRRGPRISRRPTTSRRVHPAEPDWIWVELLPSHESYEDLVDFTERVRDPRAHDLLEHSIEGRGPSGASRTRCRVSRAPRGTAGSLPRTSAALVVVSGFRLAAGLAADEGQLEPRGRSRSCCGRPRRDGPRLVADPLLCPILPGQNWKRSSPSRGHPGICRRRRRQTRMLHAMKKAQRAW
jgi:hypothetical protein